MKKTYSESELKELAKSTLEKFPKAEKVFAVKDGNIFLDRNRAELHVGIKGQILEIVRPIVADEETKGTEDKTKPRLVAEIIAAIEAANNLEDLKEFEIDTRATVIKAYQKKETELNEAFQKKQDEIIESIKSVTKIEDLDPFKNSNLTDEIAAVLRDKLKELEANLVQ